VGRSPSEDYGRSPTLTDVARVAGVSLATAARVLRDPETKVAPELAERVRRAADELHYVPNMLARSLRGGTPTMVGLVVGDMLDPYYGTIAETVTEAAETEHRMVAIVSNMQRSAELELKQCQQLWEHRVSGLILAGGGFDQQTHFEAFRTTIERIRGSGVSVASLSPRGIEVPTFCVDNFRVGEIMAETVLRDGHRRIGIIMGPHRNQVTALRAEAAKKTVTKGGGSFTLSYGEYTAESGAGEATRMLSNDPTISAFVVGGDAMAVGVVGGLVGLGYSVPGDISVVSAGRARAGGWSSPALTTVDLRLEECARLALDHVARRHSGATHDEEAGVLLEPRLVQGGSVVRVRQ
jgi:LacI family transcriptional regulator